ncbi:ABC transporter substrate-binding protein [Tissierella praeacuta]|uniref:ABC transporter substrate-binding protein n=1 Tax=Tissierella praeacuta TaxID=43131 RepID=UPI00334282A7
MSKGFIKKTIITLCIGVITIIGITGCNKEDKIEVIKKEDKQSGTRIIPTEMGEVEVPESPKRVLVQYVIGDVLALGIEPVGISEVYDGAAFEELIKDIPSVGHPYDWKPENVMKLEPDLILSISKDDYDSFSKIAPTVYVPYDTLSMEERVRLVGKALNREEEAEKVLNNYYEELEKAKTKLENAGIYKKTVSMVEGGLNQMIVMGQKHGAGTILYAVLSLNPPESVRDNVINKELFSESISFEVLPEYCGDYLIRSSYEGMDDLSKNEIWTSIPAIKNNKFIEMDFGLSYYTDIYSTKYQIDYIVNSLLEVTK